jgi:hypothetical protein
MAYRNIANELKDLYAGIKDRQEDPNPATPKKCKVKNIHLGPLVTVNSPESPISVSCEATGGGTRNGDTMYRNSVTEPFIAIHRRYPNIQVVMWQNDRWNGGRAGEVPVAYTFDNGLTWTERIIPFVICAGAHYSNFPNLYPTSGKVTDVDVYIDSVTNLVFLQCSSSGAAADSPNSGWGVVRGRINPFLKTIDFELPILLDPLTFPNINPISDRGGISTDRFQHNIVYHWGHLFHSGNVFISDEVRFTRNLNFGDPNSWEPVRVVYQPALDPPFEVSSQIVSVMDPNRLPTLLDTAIHGPQIKTLNNGAIIIVMVRTFTIQPVSGPNILYKDVVTIRSFDKGVTWEQKATILIRNMNFVSTGHDPSFPKLLSRDLPGEPSIDVNPTTGAVYVATYGNFTPDTSFPSMLLVSSWDNGNTWSVPIVASRTPSTPVSPAQSFLGDVAVTETGIVAITYYDFRFYTGNPSGPLESDFWVALYRDCGNGRFSFLREIRLTDVSFDMRKVPLITGPLPGVGPSSGPGLGEYMGLAAAHNQITAAFVIGTDMTANPHPMPGNPTVTLIDVPLCKLVARSFTIES